MTVVYRLLKRGMFIPSRKDMTANDVVHVFLQEVIPLKGSAGDFIDVNKMEFGNAASASVESISLQASYS